MFRQVPGLPRVVAGTGRRAKTDIGGIEDRIMDPIARRAAQRAAKETRDDHDTRHSSPSFSTAYDDIPEGSALQRPHSPFTNPPSHNPSDDGDNETDVSDSHQITPQDQIPSSSSSTSESSFSKKRSSTSAMAGGKKQKVTESRSGPAKKTRRQILGNFHCLIG